MKNILIPTVLALLITSCAQSQYSSLDNQYAQSEDFVISEKYNHKNCITESNKKENLVKQIAIATQK